MRSDPCPAVYASTGQGDHIDAAAFFDFEHSDADRTTARTDSFLGHWSDHDWRTLLDIASRRIVHEGETMIHAGGQVRGLVIVASGELRASTGSGRKRRELAVFRDGDVLGEVSFLDGGVATASVEATRETQALEILRSAFDTWAVQHPSLAIDVFADLGRILAGRLRRTQGSMTT